MDHYDVFLDELRKGSRFLIASHYNPDGDAIGSTIALGFILRQMGKESVLYNRDPLPPALAFLPNSASIIGHIDEGDSFDMAIMVDCAQRKRISDEFANFGRFGKVACVDHHLLEAPEADVVLLDSDAASTGEVVLRLLTRTNLTLNKDIAQCIYTTLVVDTGFFKYSSTNARILSLAADMVGAGAEPWTIAKNLEESYAAARMKLLALSLGSLRFEFGGKYATMEVLQRMLRKTGAVMEMSDEFAVYPRSVEGVEVAALFREMGGGRIKVSLRSKDYVDVAAIAVGFSGGGHVRAAGFQMRATLSKAKARVKAAVESALYGRNPRH